MGKKDYIKKGAEMKLICFGDSLTFGSVGHSYIKYLKKGTNYKVKNKGINGDTTMHMLSRLKPFLNKSNPKFSDTYIVCIGANDLFLPYLASVSFLWKIQMTPRIAMMQCLENDDLFEKKYREIIQNILSKKQNLIVLGLPYLELKDFPNSKIDKRNMIIKNLADEFKITYIDTSNIQKGICNTVIKKYSWKHKNFLRFIEGIIFPVMPFLKDFSSDRRHLNFTDDGVHWNSVLAKAVSAKIIEHLRR